MLYKLQYYEEGLFRADTLPLQVTLPFRFCQGHYEVMLNTVVMRCVKDFSP